MKVCIKTLKLFIGCQNKTIDCLVSYKLFWIKNVAAHKSDMQISTNSKESNFSNNHPTFSPYIVPPNYSSLAYAHLYLDHTLWELMKLKSSLHSLFQTSVGIGAVPWLPAESGRGIYAYMFNILLVHIPSLAGKKQMADIWHRHCIKLQLYTFRNWI